MKAWALPEAQLTMQQLFVKNTRTELNRLLQARIDHPEQMDEIDAEIRRTFAQTHAVMVLDMAGFSKTSVLHGILPALQNIYRTNQLTVPLIEKHQGDLIRLEADNIFAVFPSVDSAVTASVDILLSLRQQGQEVSIGIGYGEVLMIAAENPYAKDMYGCEFNLAAKLGEDLADHGEILLTEAAFKKIGQIDYEWEQRQQQISGLLLTFYKPHLPE